MLNEQYLDNNVEQGIASYIDYLNNIRLSDLLNSLDAILSTETDKLSDLATRSANALSNLDLANDILLEAIQLNENKNYPKKSLSEIYRKEVHEQFPALYPDDIENISNMSEEQSYLCCQIQATLLQRMRSSTPIDTSCWCTCPKKESQN